MEDLAFVVDITTNLNELYLHRQRKRQVMHSMSDHIHAFAVKLTLREAKINNKNFVHFPAHLNSKVQNTQKYPKQITKLEEDFDYGFTD